MRRMEPHDADDVARLHAESWRRTYRGILADAYLDREADDDRRRVWRERLAAPDPRQVGFVAIDDAALLGFAFAYLDADATWGTKLDNLHVAAARQGRGVGRALLAAVARHALTARHRGLFLWVFERNGPARAFYERLGALAVERVEGEAPDGTVLASWRYAWRDAASLVTD